MGEGEDQLQGFLPVAFAKSDTHVHLQTLIFSHDEEALMEVLLSLLAYPSGVLQFKNIYLINLETEFFV